MNPTRIAEIRAENHQGDVSYKDVEWLCKEVERHWAESSTLLVKIKRLRTVLEYVASYRFGFDGTEAGRLATYAHNELKNA